MGPTDDPAFQPPQDPLDGVSAKLATMTVVRDVPITTVNTSWDVQSVRGAMQSLCVGIFDQPSQLVESMVGDSRMQAADMARTCGLLGSPMSFRPPKALKHDPIAKKCCRAFERIWPLVGNEATLRQLLRWAIHLGFGIGQLNWDTTSGGIWRPYLSVWNPRYSYYHFGYRCYIAIGMDGQYPVQGGNGTWVLHAPNTEYRGFIHGAMRAVAPWWLARNYALRDWARFSERNGMPWTKGKVPAAGNAQDKANFISALGLLGQETTILLPQGNDGKWGFDVEALEFNVAGATEGFEKLIAMCNGEITLALMAQNLTTDVKEGSLAAARVHADVKEQILAADARALAETIYTQIARPFALFNFGDARYAPRVSWDTTPPDDEVAKSTAFKNLMDGLMAGQRAGVQVENVDQLARSFGLRMRSKRVPPILPGGNTTDADQSGKGGMGGSIF
jgi:Protein of unknown function (DUF935)